MHNLQLATVPFKVIASGTKTIESRLYDEKRQMIQLGEFYSFKDQLRNGVLGIESIVLQQNNSAIQVCQKGVYYAYDNQTHRSRRHL